MELISHSAEPPWAAHYLRALEQVGVPSTACKMAGITKRTVLKYANECREFEYECEQAEERFNDTLELEAIRRARDGVLETIYFKGEACGEKRVYSDTLMAQLLKGRRSRIYGEKKEVNFSGGVEVVLAPITQIEASSLPVLAAEYRAIPEVCLEELL